MKVDGSACPQLYIIVNRIVGGAKECKRYKVRRNYVLILIHK